MTVKEILDALGINNIDDHFESTTALPFAVIKHEKTNRLFADDKPYANIEENCVELYTDRYRNDELTTAIENALNDNGYLCETEDDYIAEEKLYRVTFYYEELITNG